MCVSNHINMYIWIKNEEQQPQGVLLSLVGDAHQILTAYECPSRL